MKFDDTLMTKRYVLSVQISSYILFLKNKRAFEVSFLMTIKGFSFCLTHIKKIFQRFGGWI